MKRFGVLGLALLATATLSADIPRHPWAGQVFLHDPDYRMPLLRDWKPVSAAKLQQIAPDALVGYHHSAPDSAMSATILVYVDPLSQQQLANMRPRQFTRYLESDDYVDVEVTYLQEEGAVFVDGWRDTETVAHYAALVADMAPFGLVRVVLHTRDQWRDEYVPELLYGAKNSYFPGLSYAPPALRTAGLPAGGMLVWGPLALFALVMVGAAVRLVRAQGEKPPARAGDAARPRWRY